MPNGNERTYVGDKHADYLFTCCERDPSKKNAAHFVSPTAKKVRHTKNGGRQAAPRLRLVVKKTEFTGKMCASATFHHLFYAMYVLSPDIYYHTVPQAPQAQHSTA